MTEGAVKAIELCIAMAGLYLLGGHQIGTVPYMLIWTVLFAALGTLLLRWLDTRGARIFQAL